MKNYHTFLCILFILFLSLSTIIVVLTYLKKSENTIQKKEDSHDKSIPVYCLMITGQTDMRRSYAKISIKNFLEQSYANKNLIILNQSNVSLLSREHTNILEVYIDEPHSLGTLRNISLQFVPPNAIWTTWDDDDWRHTHYLTTMISIFDTKEIEFMMFQNRLEYNVRTKFMFRTKMKYGTMIFFAKQNPFLTYSDKDVLEDIELKQFALENLKYYIYNNDPKMYLRLIHQANTSVYVDPKKHKLKKNQNAKTYFEFDVSEVDSRYINNIISKEYKNVLRI
jgi:hypothetical protein